jgi:hypothetical protein
MTTTENHFIKTPQPTETIETIAAGARERLDSIRDELAQICGYLAPELAEFCGGYVIHILGHVAQLYVDVDELEHFQEGRRKDRPPQRLASLA